MIEICALCGGKINNKKSKSYVLSCGYSSAYVDADPIQCWRMSENQLQQSCALIFSLKGLKTVKRLRAYELVKEIGEAAVLGLFSAERVLIKFSAEDRGFLLSVVPIDSYLREFIVKTIDNNELDVKSNLSAPVKYDHLPADLKDLAARFHRYLESRYNLLVSKGHIRSVRFVSRYMSDTVSFLNFMAERGHASWYGFSKQLLVDYLQTYNKKLSSSLKTFLKFNELNGSPFKKIQHGQIKRKGTALIETPVPKIMTISDLEQFINDIKQTRSAPEYALAWMVCRMGLTLEKAYSLNLAHFQMNSSKELVFKPAFVWVALPVHIQKIIGKMIYEIRPDWYKSSSKILSLTPLFHHYIANKNIFADSVLKNQARLLRSSAIFAMMQKGHLDRVSITKTTGVSMKVITNLERLFTVDLHQRLDPKLIAQRNKHILGEVNE